jgi:hypothetical protein
MGKGTSRDYVREEHYRKRLHTMIHDRLTRMLTTSQWIKAVLFLNIKAFRNIVEFVRCSDQAVMLLRNKRQQLSTPSRKVRLYALNQKPT